jgi:peptidoglycan/xylan/chitin deacetylase (PgdA/CDA1 family)
MRKQQHNQQATMKIICIISTTLLLAACSNPSPADSKAPMAVESKEISKDSAKENVVQRKPASVSEIMARKQVPVLCYHHIRPGKANNLYEVTVDQFKSQMKILADSGYKTVLPDQMYDYLYFGAPLPEKPVMITYDDTDEEQFSIAKPEMDQYGFKGVYFIMTISIGRPNYMSQEQIKQLSDEGHYIASHTWDHSRFDRYKSENLKEIGNRKRQVNDFELQLSDTKKKLEEITGKKVEHFAYPFGVWNKAGIPELQQRGYKQAFQLAAKRDSLQPLHTIRRIIVAPQWSATGMIQAMNSSFR